MFNTSSPNVRKQIYELLTNRWALGCLLAITCQQIIEASMIVWLVKMMARIASGRSFFPYLSLYLLSIALFYIPNGIALILKTTWKQQAQRSFIEAFVSSNKNNIGEWSNKGLKEEKLSILTAEGPAAINALIDYAWDLFQYVLSVVFNIMALSIVVEPLFAVAYSISLSCVLVVMKLKRRAQRQLTRKALTARVDLCQSLFAAWDNVLLGNFYNFNIWQEKTEQRLDRCLQRNVALERFDQFLAIFVSLVTSIPSLLVVAFFMVTNKDDPVRLSAFVVILPLLFNILSYTYQTLSLVFRLSMHRSKLTAIYKTIQPAKDLHVPLSKKVKWPKMHVQQSIITDEDSASENYVSLSALHSLQSYNDLLACTTRSGRVTIRGENGCGKSTALLLVKNALAKKAFFLPTHNQLSFISETNKYSTGESLRNRLLEILEKVDSDVLLLDEWDANLDSENKEKLNLLIDELAGKKCVIEVRHR
jgi:ABC-type transport system involved in cytochrome bd biosynthesis fused ATPase/permease subunit